MGLDKNRCQDKLQLQKYTKRFVYSMEWMLRLKKWGRRRSFGVPLMEKRGKVGEEKGGK